MQDDGLGGWQIKHYKLSLGSRLQEYARGGMQMQIIMGKQSVITAECCLKNLKNLISCFMFTEGYCGIHKYLSLLF